MIAEVLDIGIPVVTYNSDAATSAKVFCLKVPIPGLSGWMTIMSKTIGSAFNVGIVLLGS
jgi:hypothetical protein